MVLTQTALQKIDTVTNRVALAYKLKCGEQTIINNIKWNKEDGPLTKASAIKYIEQLTGLTSSEILQESKVTA